MKYYEVTAKCGHVGKDYYVSKKFAVAARNAKEAALKARYIPRVKHDHKDAILSVREISEEQFNERLELNERDRYFYCRNTQEQKLYCMDLELVEEQPRQEYSDKRKRIPRPYKRKRTNLLRLVEQMDCMYSDELYAG